ncbi:acyl-CoA dehydrogenase family protein [Streptomyces sp. BH105]|uniref:acyl-CoA dehydrogenase family protein n=1 Tax=Streptomyces sp. BH105 TaxID=3410408 RepID=UPI003CE82094
MTATASVTGPGVGETDVEATRSAEQATRLIARLDAIAPELEGEAVDNERAGRLSERTLELLRETKVPSMLLTESAGGLGLFPTDALRVLERLCRIDASIGWIGGNWSTAGLLLAYFQPEAAKELLQKDQPMFGASAAPTGRAVPVEGGYRLTGAWSYGSGDLQADYVLCSAIETAADGQPVTGPGGSPVTRSFTVPHEAINPKGNWDTLGLRATGSIDFTVEDAFVPESWAVNTFGPPAVKDRQVSGGMWVIIPMLHTTFALGATRRLLDELVAFAQRPSARGAKLADDVVFRTELARREVAVRSAHAFVHETWNDVDALLKAGEPLGRRNITLLRASMIHIHEVARDLATFVFEKGGGTSLRTGTMQRWVRDTFAGCQHFIASPLAYPDIAWELMGAPEDLVWGPQGLASIS